MASSLSTFSKWRGLMTYVILVILIVVCIGLGYTSGVDRAFKNLERTNYVGDIIVAHDTDGSTYTSLSILHGKDKFMNDEDQKYILLGVKHVRPKGDLDDRS